jgi:riboflavin biosynthesis pyrimidine reductase
MLLGQLIVTGRLDELCFTLSPLLVGGAPPRLLGDQDLAGLVRLRLAHLLEADELLFARYLVERMPRTA